MSSLYGVLASRRSGGKTLAAPVFLFLALLLAGCAAGEKTDKSVPAATNGVIDLTEWSWEDDGLAALDGQWSFLRVRADGKPSPIGEKTTMEVPGTWGSLGTGDGSPVEDAGLNEYGLTIRHRSEKMLALRLPNISTAYELYVNGELAAARGRPDIDAAGTIPYQLPASVFFGARGDRTELRLIVANYDHRNGGIRTPILIGTPELVQKLQTRRAAQELVVLGCLIMIGFYHVGLFLLRRKDFANVLFAMLCLFVGLRMGVIGEGFAVQLFGLGWTAAIRLEYISLVMAAWSGFAYFRAIYPVEFGRLATRASGVCAAALISIVLIADTRLFSSWIGAYQLYILAFSGLALVGLVMARLRKREGAGLSLLGVAGLVATIVNDIFFYNGWSRSVDLLPFGLLFLIAMNSFIISLRSSRTYERAETMSSQLKEWNNSLEAKIEERTEQLQRSYQTLEQAKTDLERMEQSRTQLVSNISHDLRTPMTLLRGYLEALRDNVISEPVQRDKTIRAMLTKVEGLNSLIQDLFDLSMLEARRVELEPENMTLSCWKDRLWEQYGLEMQGKGIRFACGLATEQDGETSVTIDARRMDRVFANLLYNAMRFTPEGGTIRVTMGTSSDGSHADIRVSDSGTGIEPSDLPHIFERYYRKENSRSSDSGGSGLGLAIAKETVELHGGNIEAWNSDEGGTVFRLRIPVDAADGRATR